jgi:transposase
MKELGLHEALKSLLTLEYPWEITSVDVQSKVSVVDVYISYIRGSEFKCPECGNECKVHDSVNKRVRHLDLFQYRCYLNYKVPRVNCQTHGVKTFTNLPLVRSKSHFSFFLNSK